MNNTSTHNHRNSKTTVALEQAANDVSTLRETLMGSFRVLLRISSDRVIGALESRNRELLICLKYMDHIKEGSNCLKDICRPLVNEPAQSEIMQKANDLWYMAKTVTTCVASALASLHQAVDGFIEVYRRIETSLGSEGSKEMLRDLDVVCMGREPVYRELWIEFVSWVESKGVRWKRT